MFLDPLLSQLAKSKIGTVLTNKKLLSTWFNSEIQLFDKTHFLQRIYKFLINMFLDQLLSQLLRSKIQRVHTNARPLFTFFTSIIK